MPNIDFNCSHCQHYKALPQNDSANWLCQKYDKEIDRRDPNWCVCRTWRPAPGSFPEELRQYFSEVAPGTLNHLKSKELYRTMPEYDLMALV